ncbi:MAG: hypothetical protein OXC12_06830 [Spirochaetaceae bacterium]|nr:hypothetical protein [Spirochaetaceae bacterium]
MTNAERFQKALQTIFSTPPEQVEQINQQAKDDYAAFGRQEIREDRAKQRTAARRNRN